ncbi:hypothetical protein [Roseobacter sp.]|uniref:hypothetical protein n=1 Tax=Roseobacter sp. TaxID=1907202 RepID=UPI003296A5E8
MGQDLYAFDPVTRARVAWVAYHPNGTCRAEFSDGTVDHGQFGLEGDTYWTRYTGFRAGETHRFYLVEITPKLAQAYHVDGRQAFLQTPLKTLPNFPCV